MNRETETADYARLDPTSVSTATTPNILFPDFVANAVRIGYRYSEARATVRSLSDYRRALTVHPSEITVGDLAGPFKAIYARRYAAWDERVVAVADDDLPIGW